MFSWLTKSSVFCEVILDSNQIVVDYSSTSSNSNTPFYIEGKVILHNLYKRSVWYESIQIGFVQSIEFLIDSSGGDSNFFVDSITRVVEMSLKKYISEPTEFKFKIPIHCKYHRILNDHLAVISYINKSLNNLETIYEPIVIDKLIQNFETITASSDDLRPNANYETSSAYTAVSSQNGTVDYDHSDLVGGHCSCCVRWLSSYKGETFRIKHEVRAEITSNWLTTYSAKQSADLHKIATNRTNNLSMLHQFNQSPEELIINIPGFRGTCYVSLQGRIVDVKEGIKANLIVRKNSVPIYCLYLMLIKAEYLAEQPYENTLLIYQLIGEESNEIKSMRKEEPNIIFTNNNSNSDKIDLANDYTANIQVPLESAMAYLIPSFDSSKYGLPKFRVDDGGEIITKAENSETTEDSDRIQITRGPTTTSQVSIATAPESVDANNKELLINTFGEQNEELLDSISVRYYLRLVVEDEEGRSSWNTAEVYIYHSNVSIDLSKIHLEDINSNIGEIV